MSFYMMQVFVDDSMRVLKVRVTKKVLFASDKRLRIF